MFMVDTTVSCSYMVLYFSHFLCECVWWLFLFIILVSFNSVRVKYKIFLSAMEYLPFSSGDDSKGSFEEIIERYLCFFLSMP